MPQSKKHLRLYYMVGPASHANSFLRALEQAFENMWSKNISTIWEYCLSQLSVRVKSH